jgi:hypothetical protein
MDANCVHEVTWWECPLCQAEIDEYFDRLQETDNESAISLLDIFDDNGMLKGE